MHKLQGEGIEVDSQEGAIVAWILMEETMEVMEGALGVECCIRNTPR